MAGDRHGARRHYRADGDPINAARRPTLLDVQVLLFLGGIGVWCVVLALKSMRG